MKPNPIRFIQNYYWYIIGIVFFIAIVVFGGCFFLRLRNSIMDKDNTIAALQDTVTIIKNNNGSQTATIAAFRTSRVKDIIRLKTKDSTIIRLQNVLSKYSTELNRGGSAAVFTTATNATVSSASVIRKIDTFYVKSRGKDSTVYLFPQYSSSFHLGKWIVGTTLATKDTTFVSVRTYNEYQAVIGERGGFLRKKEPFVDITTMSPYDSIHTVRAFITSAPAYKKWGISIFGGYGVTIQKSPIMAPLIGVGISYSFIRF